METGKLNFESIKNVLSRAELKNIIAGECQATDNGATVNGGGPGDGYCYITCTDSCGHGGTACATYSVCG